MKCITYEEAIYEKAYVMIYSCESWKYDVILMLILNYLKNSKILKSFTENILINVFT